MPKNLQNLRTIFSALPNLSVAVVGDYCLDEYFRIDAALNEPSLETGLTAYQCVRVETFPGAAGTVAKNFANLGVGKVYAVGYVGDDGRGIELLRGLDRLGVDRGCVVAAPGRTTPAYTKPWITENGVSREMNRIDIKNWTETPKELADTVMAGLDKLTGQINALVIMDQMTEENCGLVTDGVRERLAEIARENPELVVYADSRSRIGKFRDMIIKGNEREILRGAFEENAPEEKACSEAEYAEAIRRAGEIMHGITGRPVVTTLGPKGIVIREQGGEIAVPGIRLCGQLDVCGAGDMFTAAFVSALAAGADLESAGAAGNAAAAVCVTQLGTSGFVTAEMILERLR
ncbi:MAG: PfkB family carbohydrate kinase [Firmicutes bacterium]|nr:PfkB family carbohydrate kinase [Bacillota bacterium]